MTFSIHGLAVARGIAIGKAVLVASSRVDVAHYFIQASQVPQELERVTQARSAVMAEVQRLRQSVPKDAPPELPALLEVHLMLLQDEMLAEGVRHWIADRFYNAEWALTSQLEVVSRQFDEMEDPYLRERKADMEQVAERVLQNLKGTGSPMARLPQAPRSQQELHLEDTDVPLVLVAHELSHLREMNHSAAFWDVVRSVLPQYESAQVPLKQAAPMCCATTQCISTVLDRPTRASPMD